MRLFPNLIFILYFFSFTNNVFPRCAEYQYLFYNSLEKSSNVNFESKKVKLLDEITRLDDRAKNLAKTVLENENISTTDRVDMVDKIRKITEFLSKPTRSTSKAMSGQIYEGLSYSFNKLLSYTDCASRYLDTLSSVLNLLYIRSPYKVVIAASVMYLFYNGVKPNKPYIEDAYSKFSSSLLEIQNKFGEDISRSIKRYLDLQHPAIGVHGNADILKNTSYTVSKIETDFEKLKTEKLSDKELGAFNELPMVVKYPEHHESKLTNWDPQDLTVNYAAKQLGYSLSYILSLVLYKPEGISGVLLKLSEVLNEARTLDNETTRLSLLDDLRNNSLTDDDKNILAKMIDIEYVYANLSDILGIHRLKSLLSDITVKYIKPVKYDLLSKHIQTTHILEHAEENLVLMQEIIRTRISDALNIDKNLEVSGRVKSVESLVGKLERNKPLSIIYDYYAFRVVSDSRTSLYAALLDLLPKSPTSKPINLQLVYDIETLPSSKLSNENDILPYIFATAKTYGVEFDKDNIINVKDYIKKPKANGYQSLHASMFMNIGSGNKTRRLPFEIQFRTPAMHRHAEYGVADHNKYKGELSFESAPFVQYIIDNEYDAILGVRKKYFGNTEDLIDAYKKNGNSSEQKAKLLTYGESSGRYFFKLNIQEE